MTYNTKIEIEKLQETVKALTELVTSLQAKNDEAIEHLKKELSGTIQSQREEIIRLRIELERAHKEDRRRRLAARKRLEK